MRLVLLPGLNGSSTLFGPLLAHLHPALKVQALELSTEDSQAYKDLADRLLGRLGNTPYVLLGESYSGPLAYQLALYRPPGLRGVIFAASFLSRPHPLLPLLQHLPLPRWLLGQNTLLNLFCLNGQTSAELTLILRKEIQRLPTLLLRARLHSLSQLQKPALQLELPALHLLAKQDRLVTRKAQASLQTCCTQLTEIALDGPHFLLQSQPQASADAIERFITGLPAD
ncbi:alpha/beta fold hydrolase [Pseudomonas anguilliseptica]|uniref:alpha/beta fold hydrolase n=1 Tax=Pseudomonas anguilliseptica TaxID=53406 RepID=UPI003736B428